MCDTEILITAVGEHPCLWDTNHTDYRNREIKDIAWDEVCSEVYLNWADTEVDEKRRKYMEAKRKWNNVRDCYRRDLNKLRSNPTHKSQKKYIYADLLSFVAPMLKSKSSAFEFNCSDEDDNIIQEKLEQSRDFLKQDDSEMDPLFATTTNQNSQISAKEICTQTVEIASHKPEIEKRTFEEDDDTKFLLSFRSDMHSMNKKQKIDFKIGILRLLKSIYDDKDVERLTSLNNSLARPPDINKTYVE